MCCPVPYMYVRLSSLISVELLPYGFVEVVESEGVALQIARKKEPASKRRREPWSKMGLELTAAPARRNPIDLIFDHTAQQAINMSTRACLIAHRTCLPRGDLMAFYMSPRPNASREDEMCDD